MNNIFQGEIIRLSENDTVIKVDRTRVHPLYLKRYTVTKRFHAHNPGQIGVVGDLVEFSEIKPMSKTKHWQVSKVIKENHGTKS